MSEEVRFEIQIRETREIVRRMDRQIELVGRLLAESETSIRGVQGDFTNSIGMELVWCPPGTFMMGSPEDNGWLWDDETLHRVTLTRGFWIGRYPVTQGQWEEVMGGNPSYFKESGPNAPVEMVNWDEAQGFCRALSQRDGRGYRLPTEAEWEYACRAGSTGAWHFGDVEKYLWPGKKSLWDLTADDEKKLGYYAWYQENPDWYEENSDGRTHPVGQKKPNAWGIHDMYGNVLEWCQDWYGRYPEGPTTDPRGPETGCGRVGRGGSWDNYIEGCRSARRSLFPPDHCDDSSGFRVAVSSAL